MKDEEIVNNLLDAISEKKELQKAMAKLMYHMLTASVEWRGDVELNKRFEECVTILKKQDYRP